MAAEKATGMNAAPGDERPTNPWRLMGWSAAALVLLTPLVAMPFTDEVSWTVGDFVFAAVSVLGVGMLLELVVRTSNNPAYRAAAGAALLAAFTLVGANGAVGIIGPEDDAVNLLYYGVLAIGLLGALLVRFRPRGMARAMFATALAQAAVALGAAVAGAGTPYGGALEIVALNGFFVALWVGSALLFRRAARERPPQARHQKADQPQR